jgi:glutamate dehydrogenase/leucine dehydrogenase
MTARDLLPTAVLEMEAPYDPFLEAMLDFEEAAQQLDLESWIVHRLRHAEREVTVNLPLIRDHGQAVTVAGLRVQHTTSPGPTLGPVRFCATAHLNHVKVAAMRMTWQCALLGLPFGGAAGAIVANALEMSERELKQLFKDYVNSLRDLIGPHKDVLALDGGSNERTAAWMLDSDARARGLLELGVVTGKPAVLGGLPAPRAAAGRGLFLLLLQILGIGKSRIALQGFGSLGAVVARHLHEAGARVVGVADVSGGLLRKDGIDIPALAAYTAQRGVIFGFPEAAAACNADVLEGPCDLLILAAAERQITAVNAEHIQAAVVVEVADAAVTRTAEQALEKRGVLVVPDLLANAGSTLAAFLEWRQNLTYTIVTADELETALRSRIASTWAAVHDYARKHSTNLRRAAHLIAVDKVASVVRLR